MLALNGDGAMVGITLSSEQIRVAPADARRWIEHQVAVSLGLDDVVGARRDAPRLVELTVDQVDKILPLIEEALPVVNVFFEFGREGASAGVDGLEAFRLIDILRHARLQTMEQLAECLDIINAAVRRVRADFTSRSMAWINEGIVSFPSRRSAVFSRCGNR
jgi:hypothetical protein